jgi:hypothetical protein
MNNLILPPVRDDSALVSRSFGNVVALIEKNLPPTPDFDYGWHSQRSFSVDDLKRNLTMTAELRLPMNQITTASLRFRWFTQTDRHRKDDNVLLSDPIDFHPEETFVPTIVNGDEVMWMDVVHRPFSEDQLANHVVTRLVSGHTTARQSP